MRIRLVTVAASVVAAGVGVGLGLGLSGGSGTSPSTAPARLSAPSTTSPSTAVTASQLTSIQTGCRQWLREASTEPGTAQWCTDMTQWMDTYMGRDGVGPQMMWGDASDLSAICEHWLRTSPPSGAPTDATGWCDSMVTWMTAHIGSWSGRGTWGAWMRSGPMAGFGDPTNTSPPTTSPSTTGTTYGYGGPGYGPGMMGR